MTIYVSSHLISVSRARGWLFDLTRPFGAFLLAGALTTSYKARRAAACCCWLIGFQCSMDCSAVHGYPSTYAPAYVCVPCARARANKSKTQTRWITRSASASASVHASSVHNNYLHRMRKVQRRRHAHMTRTCTLHTIHPTIAVKYY